MSVIVRLNTCVHQVMNGLFFYLQLLSFIIVGAASSNLLACDNLEEYGATQKTTRCVVIDSGGLGVIPLCQFAALEIITGKPFYDLFDVIAGSGSGGVIAVLLTHIMKDGKQKERVLTARQVLKIHTHHLNTLYKPVGTLSSYIPGMAKQEYDVDNLKNQYALLVGDSQFVPQNFKKRTIVFGYNLTQRQGVVADTHQSLSNSCSNRIKWSQQPVSDLLLLSSIIPGSVKPQSLKVDGFATQSVFVDGSFWASNPSSVLSNFLLQEKALGFKVFSFGVGLFAEVIPDLTSLSGLRQAFCEANAFKVEDEMQEIKRVSAVDRPQHSNPRVSYYRHQPKITGQVILPIDDLTQANLSKWLSASLEIIRSVEFAKFVTQLRIKNTWDAEQVIRVISQSLNTIDFEDVAPFTLNATLEYYLRLAGTQQESFLKDQNCFRVLATPEDAQLGAARHWIDEMVIVINRHNGGKNIFNKLKSTTGDLLHLGSGSHAYLLKQLDEFKNEIQTAFKKMRGEDKKFDARYFEIMSGINVLDRSPYAKSKVINKFIAEAGGRKFINDYFKDKLYPSLSIEKLDQSYVEQLKQWVAWMIEQIDAPIAMTDSRGRAVANVTPEAEVRVQLLNLGNIIKWWRQPESPAASASETSAP